ncbi:hypothetical protein GOODEAATRI_026648 [Goodea atripinnis]|uniref:Uncharacterized protein n=1 Tax=Goodea atripinnis TaxID=208336 RepID=A0ABV0Q218_9TELE
MPGSRIAFGVMSTPGACADDLRHEALHAVVPREPDAVCLMAPSNNLTASKTSEQAGQAFEQYLLAVLRHWPKWTLVKSARKAEATQDQVFVCDVPRSPCPGEATEGSLPEERGDEQCTNVTRRSGC